MRKPAGKSVLALLMLVLYLLPAALAASAALHKCVHDDADTPEHHCAATVIALGQVDTVPAAVVVVVPAIGCLQALTAEVQAIASGDYWLLPGRAPPVSLA
jgi:hypothetical protein